MNDTTNKIITYPENGGNSIHLLDLCNTRSQRNTKLRRRANYT